MSVPTLIKSLPSLTCFELKVGFYLLGSHLWACFGPSIQGLQGKFREGRRQDHLWLSAPKVTLTLYHFLAM